MDLSEQTLPGVTAVYRNPDARPVAPDVDPARAAVAMHFERTRIGGHTGWSVYRCLRCRALLEERLTEQEQHAIWHARTGDPLETEQTHGWGGAS